MSTAHINHIKKESELAWEFWGRNYLDQYNPIQFSSPLQSTTASLSSAFESGAHSVPIPSVVGYHYRGYTAGVSVGVAKMIRVYSNQSKP